MWVRLRTNIILPLRVCSFVVPLLVYGRGFISWLPLSTITQYSHHMFVCIIISKLAGSGGAVWEDSVCCVCAKSFGIGGCSIKSFRKVMEDLLQNKSFKTSIPFLSICPTFEPSPITRLCWPFYFSFSISQPLLGLLGWGWMSVFWGEAGDTETPKHTPTHPQMTERGW